MSTIKELLSKVLSFFKADYHYSLESFILSKNPQTSMDVEYWTVIYNQKHSQQGGL